MPVLVLNPRVFERPDEESIRRMKASAPPKRGAAPEEIGMLAVSLAGTAAGQLAGTAIPIDGGLHDLAGGPERRNTMWAAYKNRRAGGLMKNRWPAWCVGYRFRRRLVVKVL